MIPRKVEKPWGYELIYAETEKYAGKILFVLKGHELSLQYHEVKDETMYIYRGVAELASHNLRYEDVPHWQELKSPSCLLPLT